MAWISASINASPNRKHKAFSQYQSDLETGHNSQRSLCKSSRHQPKQSLLATKIDLLFKNDHESSFLHRLLSPQRKLKLTKLPIPRSKSPLKRVVLDKEHQQVLQQIGMVQQKFKFHIRNMDNDEAIEGIPRPLIYLPDLMELFVISVNQNDLTMLIDSYKIIALTYISYSQWNKALLFLN